MGLLERWAFRKIATIFFKKNCFVVNIEMFTLLLTVYVVVSALLTIWRPETDITQAKTSHNLENFLGGVCCLPAVQLSKLLTISELFLCHLHNENSNTHDISYCESEIMFCKPLKSCSIMLVKWDIVLPCLLYIFLAAKNICTALFFYRLPCKKYYPGILLKLSFIYLHY